MREVIREIRSLKSEMDSKFAKVYWTIGIGFIILSTTIIFL